MYRNAAEPAPLVVIVAGRAVRAIDRRSGQMVWNHWLAETNERQVLVTRVLVEQDRVILVSSSDPRGTWSAYVLGVVTCLDYHTGRQLWEQHFDSNTIASQFNPTLLLEAGQLLVATARDVFAFVAETGAPQWHHHFVQGTHQAGSTALALPGLAVQADRDRS